MMEIPFMKHFIREELDVKGTAVLDIGCGFGFYAKYFLEQGANTVECIDKNPAMIELARKYVSSHRAKYLVADMDELQARNRFDIAFEIFYRLDGILGRFCETFPF
jgi:2-polyprenyl-3-methyl-5-hydroxy-6-metoxy-1,4-benzoquinol methylase